MTAPETQSLGSRGLEEDMRSQGAEHSVACGSVETSTPSPAGLPAALAEPYIPVAIHLPEADTLEFVEWDAPTVTRWVSSRLDVLLDLATREPIGFRIHGWSRIAPPADHGASGSTEATTGSQKPDPERLIERLQSAGDRTILNDLMEMYADPAINRLTYRAAKEIARRDEEVLQAAALLAAQQAEIEDHKAYRVQRETEIAAWMVEDSERLAGIEAELQRVKEERDAALRLPSCVRVEGKGLVVSRADFTDVCDRADAAEASLREAAAVLEPFAKADLHEWSGRGAVAPFIDRSHFEAAAAFLSRLPEHTPQTEEGTP